MKNRGFTLVEVLISIALIAIALFGVMGAVAYGTKHSGSGAELTEATHLARSIINYLQETSSLDTVQLDPYEVWPTADSGLADPPDVFRQLDEPPLGGMPFEPHQLERYRRRIESQRVTDDPLNYRYNLARVRVSVFWSSKQGERKVVMTGLISTHRKPPITGGGS